MKILQVNTADIGGGCERVAWNLMAGYRDCGHQSWMAVGYRRSSSPDVFVIPNRRERHWWARLCQAADEPLRALQERSKSAWILRRLLASAGEPARALEHWLGHEDFNHPGTRRLLSLAPARPDLLHCHNLHGAYFDLRELARLSSEIPVVLTLHDAWLTTGHCAHSLGCERWETGCGRCPDLTLYPAIRRDATARNWRVKRAILGRCRLRIATPSRWLMERAARSVLEVPSSDCRVIPNGIDLSLFRRGNREEARLRLGLPLDRPILLFAAAKTKTNVWKDHDTIRRAAEIMGSRARGPILLIALGEEAPAETAGQVEIRYAGYVPDADAVAGYYRAADVYLHAARADTFPNSVLEAQACGLPVVATAVGGIPEQVADRRTGILTRPGDAEGFAAAVENLTADDALRRTMGYQGAERATRLYDVRRQVHEYLDWFTEILDRQAMGKTHA